jgi:hypothetical protein
MAESFQFTSPGFPFKTSAVQFQDFKKEHKIRQRHVRKYICSKKNVTLEERVKAAELLQK